jgi:hexosaminidase
MAAAWEKGFVLESVWHPATLGVEPRYVLVLTNHGNERLEKFRIGFSGPTRVSSNATVDGGTIVHQLSNFCEIAPPSGFVLEPGKSWTITIARLDYPVRHWTDGATTGFVIREDGSTVAALTLPTRHAALDKPRRRGTMVLPVPAEPPVPISVIPWPKSVEVTGRRTPPRGLNVKSSEGAAAAFEQLTEMLFPGEGLVRGADEGGYPVKVSKRETGFGPEAYAISFSPDSAHVEAVTQTGLLYGLVTLAQIARGARRERGFSFPTGGRIEDSPEMGWRGSHLDVARRFYSAEEMAQFLALLAWNKLNVLHWHLSDDEAWRVEIEAFPELLGKAAWRGYGMAIPPLLGSGPERSGGYYSKEIVRNLVEFAHSLNIDIVPEIDIPGHCYALLQALPHLRDNGENGPYHSIQSFPNNCLNPGVDAVYPALEKILGELCELFPSKYFHVGADEVPADAWATSPSARALNLETTGALQAHFLRRIQAFLTSKGKITGGWEEAAHGGGIDKANSYLVGWQKVEVSQKLAAEGYRVVAAPAQAYYLDMAMSEDWHECGAGWAGWSSLEKTYTFDPVAGWSAAEREKLMGIQACIWCEPMTDRAVFDRLVFPRLSAIAETGWTAPSRRDFARFKALAGLMPNLYGFTEQSGG